MASGQKTYIEKQAEQANRERAAKAAALKKAADADVLQRIKTARNRAAQERTVDSAKIQERFASRAVSRIGKDFNGLIKSRRIHAAGRDAIHWGRKGATPLGRARVELERHALRQANGDTPELRAYTDFSTAYCFVNADKVPKYTQREDVKRWVARIRGAMYHELGHMQFSIPSRMVIERADFTLDEVKAIQPDLKLITEKMVTNSWKGSMKVMHDNFGEVHQAWNMLEDQRMETAVVRDYPYAPNYLTPLITKLIILDSPNRELSWTLIGGRKYLPVEIRDASRDRFNEWFDTQAQDVKDLLHTDPTVTPADQWLEIVDSYKQATTCVDMFVAMCAAQLWLEQLNLPSSDDSHDSAQYEPMDAAEMGRREKGGATAPGQERSNVRASGGDDDGDGEGEEGGDGKSTTSSKSASNDKAPETFGTLEEIATEVLDDALNDLPADSTIGESLREAEGDGLLPYDRQTEDLPSEWVDKANTVSVGIERALQAFVTANEPIWKARQQVGVLDPLAYRTRETGAIDYRRFLDDSGREGMDVHVSMLCDNSGSMGGSMGALSAALLAMATACERVGAGYDIVLWSTEYYRVEEPTVPTLYPHLGGTEVVPALEDLKNAPVGQHVKNHLVLLFTDGAWYDHPDLTKYRENDMHINRKFVLAKYGSAGSADYGADKVVQLTDILDFPQLLEAGLRELAGGRN
jgi:hypothetical protein